MKTITRKNEAKLGALLLSLCLLIGLLPMTAFAADQPTKRNTYNVYSDEVIAGGADSRVYAVTIENVDGEDLHYVYSPDAIHSYELMNQIRAGLDEPYKSLIPTTFEDDEPFSTGLLCFSRDQETYEAMRLDWDNPEAVANALISGNGIVNVIANDDAVNVTDISVTHTGEKIVTEDQYYYDDFYAHLSELGYLGKGENRVEITTNISYKIEEIEGANYYDILNTMHVTQISAYTATKLITRDTYNVYSDEVIAGGSDSQVCAVTIKDVDGEDLHYVYSPNAIHSNELMKKIRAGLSEPYKSLIPTVDGETFSSGLLCFSRDQEKYAAMRLDWDNPTAVANALISGNGSISVAVNYDAISVTDISVIHENEKIVTEDQNSSDDFYTNPPELGYLGKGENRVEASISIGYKTEEIEGANYYDTFHSMHVAQISACTATKTEPATTPIDLPVRVLEDEESGYVPRPDLTAAFTPDSAVTAGDFNEYQGLAIDYYYPMIDAQLSEGYDIQAEYTVSVPLTDYEGDTLSGTLTIPLPDGYDGATARIKGGVSAGSYTATTVSFPVTLDMEFGTTASLNITIEYKEAQEPVVPDAPVIINGANGTWQKGGTDGLSFTSDAEFADFIKVQVDGKDLDASDYTVKEGSTIVTLKAEYLETLSAGKHTLSIVSANGTATTEFTVTEAQTGGDQTGDNQTDGAAASPQTGDSSNMMMWIVLMAVSVSVILSIVHFNRKKMLQK